MHDLEKPIPIYTLSEMDRFILDFIRQNESEETYNYLTCDNICVIPERWMEISKQYHIIVYPDGRKAIARVANKPEKTHRKWYERIADGHILPYIQMFNKLVKTRHD